MEYSSELENKNEGLNWLPLVQRQLLALLRLALNTESADMLDPCLAVCKVDWEKLYALAEKQSVVGLCWGGIERLPKQQLPNMDWLMEWLGQAEYIKTQNGEVNGAVASTLSYFKSHGLKGVILKGQGLASLYKLKVESGELKDLSSLRTSGDIDVLLGDCNPTDEFISAVCKMAIENDTPHLHATYHHCDFGKIQDTEVEAHWRASWFYTPWYNKRFQEFCQEHIAASKNWSIFKSGSDPDLKETLEIQTPSLAFNRVYVLVHIYRHLFTEGIGLRQIIDYYMVLRASAQLKDESGKLKENLHSTSSGQAFWAQQKIETMQRLKELGMERFTAAVMWIMVEGLGLDDECLLCLTDEKAGAFLLKEIMEGGNFGHYDARYSRNKKDSFLKYALRKFWKIVPMFHFGPWEVICTPFWRLWHICWWMPRHN